LSSGKSRGSNLLAIYRYFLDNQIPIEIATAVFTNGKSPACISCNDLDIPTQIISARDISLFEMKLRQLVISEQADLIALCGFMRLITAEFLDSIQIPVLNIHPALLPKYGGHKMYGMAVHEAVFAAGEKVSGATIHRVDGIYDHGEILAQKKVDISHCASPDEIAGEVLKIEHEIYAKTIAHVLQKN